MTWIKTWEGVVEKDWLDQLDHVNFLTYQRIADLASGEIWRRAEGSAESSPDLQFVMTETHVCYTRELRLGAPVEIRTSLIAWDTKRFHLFHRLESASNLVCTVETMNLCFDPTNRRVAPFPAAISSYFSSWGSSPDDVHAQLSIGRRPSRS
ncbi:thioesterase family protein [Bradyrhizobium sp. CCBAU 51745]|uniref:thioesterase family protein n=1 Tax=Bradyrhizobium sp. CCBAU 51745 TaxID=1325099 RepID=UPI00230629CD|nr:thioesterase family protein [Bradyrhizobium sp. CCBAU 51745]